MLIAFSLGSPLNKSCSGNVLTQARWKRKGKEWISDIDISPPGLSWNVTSVGFFLGYLKSQLLPQSPLYSLSVFFGFCFSIQLVTTQHTHICYIFILSFSSYENASSLGWGHLIASGTFRCSVFVGWINGYLIFSISFSFPEDLQNYERKNIDKVKWKKISFLILKELLKIWIKYPAR